METYSTIRARIPLIIHQLKRDNLYLSDTYKLNIELQERQLQTLLKLEDIATSLHREPIGHFRQIILQFYLRLIHFQVYLRIIRVSLNHCAEK